MAKKKSVLFNPAKFEGKEYDAKTRKALQDTINFFEAKGLQDINQDRNNNIWCADWIKYQKEHEIYSTMLCASGYGDDKESRFDLFRTTAMSEVLQFYTAGSQWYTFQVSILGVGPIWMGDNEIQKQELAQALKDGHLFAFGMSEKQHGADLYTNECTITPTGDGTYVANGNKYYIGNSHIANKVSVLGKNSETGEWVFWVVDSNHRNYNYVKDIQCPGNSSSRVGEFEMIEYPITDNDIIKVGDEAFADGLSTVNIGKFHCGWASAGMVSHELFEAVTHANRRIIYGKPVTNLPHIRSFLSEAFCRSNAMKLYSMRSLDYFRSMSEDDRRYLLFNPIIKNKVCREGADVTRMIMDVVCAKGYESDTYMSGAYTNADSLARLEGTAHVNMTLVVKFMQNYFFTNKEYPKIGFVNEAKNDTNLFYQTIGGLAKVQMPDYKKAYEGINIPNVKNFLALVEKFREMLIKGGPDQDKLKNMDYMLNYGEMFTVIVYAQLVLEGSQIHDVEDELVDQIFAFLIKDINKFALAQLNTQENNEAQCSYLKDMALHSPVIDKAKDFKFWQEYVQVLDGEYAMYDSVIGVD